MTDNIIKASYANNRPVGETPHPYKEVLEAAQNLAVALLGVAEKRRNENQNTLCQKCTHGDIVGTGGVYCTRHKLLIWGKVSGCKKYKRRITI